MKKSLYALLAVATLVSFSVAAKPWAVGSAQGIDEYRAFDGRGATLNFSCDMGGNNPGTRNITLTTPDNVDHSVDNTDLTAVLDGEKIGLESPWSNVGSNNWSYFWENLAKSKSTTFTVLMKGKKFTFPTAGAEALFKSPGAKGCLYF